MSLGQDVDIESYLKDGWDVAGYSVCLMAMGATSHNILLRKGAALRTCVIVLNNAAEIGRMEHSFAPAPAPSPAPKRGFFG